MAKYLDPKADLTFKKVFGEHKELLISFLNAMLPLPEGKEIVTLEYLPSEMVPVNPDKKDTIVDVRCKDKDGRQFLVEMQMYWTDAFRLRALLNTCKAYSLPADRGEKYSELKPVYTLSLVNDIAFPELPDDFYHCYMMTHSKYKEYTIDDIEMIFVELPKFKANTVLDKKITVLWLRFLTEINEHTREVDKELLADDNVAKAVSLVEESAYSDAELWAIDRYWDSVSRERTVLSEKYLLGEAKGRVEERYEIAKKLIALHLPIDSIIQATGLSKDEITSLM
jgi:predicted transposase/invertase (TIGR01784 family)